MVDGAASITIMNQKLWLLPQKAVYWSQRKTLLVADLHIGKASHFRKNGILVPDQVNQSNLDNLSHIINRSGAEHLIVLGDLFHSSLNSEWASFVDWRSTHTSLEISLVLGNHDILPKPIYRDADFNLFTKLKSGPFLFIHDANDAKDAEIEEMYLLSGHIHPAVKLRNRGRQQMKLPCFYFGKNNGLLPAFGAFTGTHVIKPRENDTVYIITDTQVVPSSRR